MSNHLVILEDTQKLGVMKYDCQFPTPALFVSMMLGLEVDFESNDNAREALVVLIGATGIRTSAWLPLI